MLWGGGSARCPPAAPGMWSGASPGSLHLKKPVPPQNLHSLRRFPSRCPPGFLFAILTGTTERGRSVRGSSRWVSAPPQGAEAGTTSCGSTVPKRLFLSPLHSWGCYQEPAGGGTQRAFLVLSCCGRILPQLPGNAAPVRQSLALPGVLEERWSWR